MTDEVYERGLGQLLDGEMTPAEAAAFAAHLRDRPDLIRDLQQHLVLWELWSQQQAPERSAQAFADSWQTRLAAEGNAEAFCRAVEVRVARPDQPPGRLSNLAASVRRAVSSLWLPGHRWATLASAAATVALVVGFFWIGAASSSAGPVVTIEGEAVCTRCILHETHDCRPAVRVVAEGTERIYYLDATAAVKECHAPFCSKDPVRVRATGTTSVDHGHLRLEATAVARTP
jgi:hypothetical protein